MATSNWLLGWRGRAFPVALAIVALGGQVHVSHPGAYEQ